MIELVTKLKEFDNHKIFRDPVTDEDAPGYSEVIKNPMCLKTIEAKVGNNEYLDLESLNADVSSKLLFFDIFLFIVTQHTSNNNHLLFHAAYKALRMFSNCIVYNKSPNSVYYREEARQQMKSFKKFYTGIANRIEAHLNTALEKMQTTTCLCRGGLESMAATHNYEDDLLIDNSEDLDVENTIPCNAHWERHKALLSKGWKLEHGSYSYGKKLLKISPELKLQFISTRAAEDFEEARQECLGDEYDASALFEKRMIEQGHKKLSKLLVNGKSALSHKRPKQTPALAHSKKKLKANSSREECYELPSFKNAHTTEIPCKESNMTHTDDVQLYPQQCKDLELVSVKQKTRARDCLAKLSPGWIPVTYKSSTKQELHFETSQNQIRFKSFKGALLFDSVLKQSLTESIAMDTFMEQQGRDKARCIVYSFGSYEVGNSKSSNTANQSRVTIDSFNRNCKVENDENNNPTTATNPVDEDFWEVDQVLQVGFKCRKMQCLIRWKGFSKEHDEWVIADDMCDTASEYAMNVN